MVAAMNPKGHVGLAVARGGKGQGLSIQQRTEHGISVWHNGLTHVVLFVVPHWHVHGLVREGRMQRRHRASKVDGMEREFATSFTKQLDVVSSTVQFKAMALAILKPERCDRMALPKEPEHQARRVHPTGQRHHRRHTHQRTPIHLCV